MTLTRRSFNFAQSVIDMMARDVQALDGYVSDPAKFLKMSILPVSRSRTEEYGQFQANWHQLG
jgi:hypothetical protein